MVCEVVGSSDIVFQVVSQFLGKSSKIHVHSKDRIEPMTNYIESSPRLQVDSQYQFQMQKKIISPIVNIEYKF